MMDTADWLEKLLADATDGNREGEEPLNGTDRRIAAAKALQEMGFDPGYLDRPALLVLAAVLRALEDWRERMHPAHVRLTDACQCAACKAYRDLSEPVLDQADALRAAHERGEGT